MRIGVGFAIVIGCIFGGFMVFGGNIMVLLKAFPHEFLTIGGGAFGALLIANSKTVMKKIYAGIRQVFKGEVWGREDYQDLLSLLYLVSRELRNKGPLGLEKDFNDPENSSLFGRYPRLVKDKVLLNFVADYLRMVSFDVKDPHQLSEIIENDIERIHQEKMKPQHALQTMADGLPAVGIVAAVLGVINTMGSIDQPTHILGGMIGSALVGTFLGVLLSYCVVGPIASRLHQIIDQDSKMYEVTRAVIVAHMQGMEPRTSVEIGRRVVPTAIAPTFHELEAVTDELPRSLSLSLAA